MRHMKNSCGTYRHTFAFNFLQCEPKAAHGPTNINTTHICQPTICPASNRTTATMGFLSLCCLPRPQNHPKNNRVIPPMPLVNERCTNGHAGVGVIGTFFCSICTHISYEIISQMKWFLPHCLCRSFTIYVLQPTCASPPTIPRQETMPSCFCLQRVLHQFRYSLVYLCTYIYFIWNHLTMKCLTCHAGGAEATADN